MIRLLYYKKSQIRKREIILSNIYRILPKGNQVIYHLITTCMPNFMILSQAVLQIFCWQDPLWVKSLSWKRGIIQPNIHKILRKVNQVIYIMYLNCIDWCHYSSSSSSPDILLRRLLHYTKCQSLKREIIQPNIYRISPKANQVIYTLDTICEPNMSLAQAVLQIFCWQGSIGL